MRPTIIVPENRRQNRLSLCGVETLTRRWLLSFCSTEAEKNVLFARNTLPLLQVLASQDTSHHQTWRAYVPLS